MKKRKSPELLSYQDKSYLLLGWREWVSLPALGIDFIKAKIDTGARTSALHAFDIVRFTSDGSDKLRFDVHPIQRDDNKIVKCTATLVDIRYVWNSRAQRELRYVIETVLVLGGQPANVEVTLTDRGPMSYRMLLGRKALQQYNVIIDPARS